MQQGNAKGFSDVERFMSMGQVRGFKSAFGEDELGTGLVTRSIPGVGSGVQIGKSSSLMEAAKAFNADEANDEQVRRLQRYHDYQARRQSFGGKVGGVVAGSLEFIPDIAAGSFLASKGLKLGVKLGSKLGAKEVLDSAMKKIAAGGVKTRIATTIAKGIGGQASMDLAGAVVGEGGPTLAAAHRERLAHALAISDEGNELVVHVIQDAPSIADLLPKAFVTGTIERGSEMSGSLLSELPGLGRLAAVGHFLTNKVAGKKGAKFAREILAKGGVNGIFEELGEEFVDATVKDLVAAISKGRLADSGQLRQLTELENAAVMVLGVGLSMGGMQIAGGGVSRALSAIPTKSTASSASADPTQGVTSAVSAQSPDAPGQQQETEVPESGGLKGTPGPNPSAPKDPIQDSQEGIQEAAAPQGLLPDAVVNFGPTIPPAGSDVEYLGRGQFGKLTGPNTGKYSAHDVVESLVDSLDAFGKGITFRTGRVAKGASKATQGTWSARQGVLRARSQGDPMIVAHEVGHALESHLVGFDQLWAEGRHKVPDDVLAEILILGEGQAKANPNITTQQQHGQEGFAEFLAGYLSENPHVVAPATEKWFLESIPPEVIKRLEKSKQIWSAYRKDGAIGQGLASIGDRSLAQKTFRKIFRRDERRNWMQGFYAKMVDDLGAFERMTAEARDIQKEIDGTELSEYFDLARLSQQLRGRHGSLVTHWLERETTDLSGARTGPGLNAIKPLLKGIKNKHFNEYLAARRTVALARQDTGRGTPIRETHISVEQAESSIAEHEAKHPMIEQAAQEYYAWTERTNEYIASTSPIYADQVANIKAGDAGDYVPLKRVFDGNDSSSGGGAGSMQRGTLTKRLFGSRRKIKPPIEQHLVDIQARLLNAHQRMLFEQMAKLATKFPQLSEFMEEVDVEQYVASQTTIKQMLAAMVKAAGISTENREGLLDLLTDALADGQLAELRKVLPESEISDVDLDDLVNRTVLNFSESWDPKRTDDPIFPIKVLDPRSGKAVLKYFSMDRRVFESFNGIDFAHNNALVELFTAVPKKIAVMGITGLSFTFGLITNPSRDLPTLYFNTRSHANAGEIFMAWIQSQGIAFADSIRMNLLRTPFEELHPQTQAWFKLHLGMSTRIGSDLREASKRVRMLGDTKFNLITATGLKDAFGILVDTYQDLIQFPEMGARMAEIRLVAKERGLKLEDIGVGSDFNDSIQLGFVGARSTTDFSAGGSLARKINRAVPFFNVQFQGPRATIEATKANPTRNLIRGVLGMALPTLALWWLNKDEEWYEALSVEERSRYWHFDWGDDNILRIPRPFEIGAMTASPIELMADAFYREDPEGATEFFGTLFKVTDDIVGEVSAASPLGFIPDVGIPLAPGSPGGEVLGRWMPVIPGVLIEQGFNKNLYWGSPIVSRANEGKHPEDQYTDFTSRAAIRMGEITGWSPQRIDHVVNYIFGSTGRSAMSTFGQGDTDIDFERDISDHAFLGRLFKRGGKLAHSENTKKVYDLYQETTKDKASDRESTELQRQRRLLLQHTTKAITAFSYMRAREEKKHKRHEISKAINDLALEALDEYKKAGERQAGSKLARIQSLKAAATRVREKRKNVERLKKAFREKRKAANGDAKASAGPSNL